MKPLTVQAQYNSKDNMITKIETKSAVAEIIDNGIFYLQYKPGSTSTIRDLLEAYTMFLKLGEGRPD